MIGFISSLVFEHLPIVNTFFKKPENDYEPQDLTGKVAIVTGANIGIGLETARNLATMGAKVYIGCRNPEKAKIAVEDIKASSGNDKVYFLKLDLSSFTSVRDFVKEFENKEQILDILINNAGGGNPELVVTKDGFESTIQCNYLSAILLSYLMLPCLKRATSSRVVNVTSDLHYKGTFNLKKLERIEDSSEYSFFTAYPDSKLFLNMMTKELALKLQHTSVTFVSNHPGLVNTNIWTKDYYQLKGFVWLASLVLLPLMSWVALTPQKAAKTSTFAAIDPRANTNGAYMDVCQVLEPHKAVNDSDLRAQLSDATFSALGFSPEF